MGPGLTAFAWVPLHARHVVEAEGFAAFEERPRCLHLFLQRYGWKGDTSAFLRTVQVRVLVSAEGIERTASRGDLAYQQMLRAGVATSLRTAATQLARDTPDLASPFPVALPLTTWVFRRLVGPRTCWAGTKQESRGR